jgi:DNA polymerase (family 10)
MRLDIAESVGETIVKLLGPYCAEIDGEKKIKIVGSVRRRKPACHDIDIVLIPGDAWELAAALKRIGKQVKGGEKMSCFITAGGHQVDIYFATPETWATLLLIRTGSKEHNIKLCAAARARGWKLCATGNGLFNEKGERIAGDSEASIFVALGMLYIPPERRN